MGAAGDAIVVLGDIVGAYGVRGAVKVRPYTEAPETLLQYSTWWVKHARETQWRTLTYRTGRLHSGALVAELRGIDSREAALALKGAEIGVPRAMLPAAGAGEIYVDALVGLAVANRAGVALGEVTGVVEHGAHPLLRVARPEGQRGAERLIPFVPAIVVEVDVDARRIVVDWGEDY